MNTACVSHMYAPRDYACIQAHHMHQLIVHEEHFPICVFYLICRQHNSLQR